MSILSFLFPEKCLFCGRVISAKEYAEQGCCSNCMEAEFVRTNIEAKEMEILPKVLALYCPFVYTDKVKDTLIRYKFQGENWLANPLSILLDRYLQACDGYAYCDYITAVPISSERMAERGYNQSAIIAGKLSHYTGIPYKQFMTRMDSAGTSQTGKMNRLERLNSTRFKLQGDIVLQEKPGILLVDDILTTGSTLNECTEILLNMGAGFVKTAVIASGRRDIGGVCA